jgi:hypothetical protein
VSKHKSISLNEEFADAVLRRRRTTATSKVDPGRCEPLTSSMPWSPVTRSSQAGSGLSPMFQSAFADLIQTGSGELMGVSTCGNLPNLSHQARSRPQGLGSPIPVRCSPW